MGYSSHDGGEEGEHSHASFVKISWISVTQDAIEFGKILALLFSTWPMTSWSLLITVFSTNLAPAALQRPATNWRPAALQPLGGTEMGRKVGLQRTSEGWLPLSPLFYPLILLCAS